MITIQSSLTYLMIAAVSFFMAHIAEKKNAKSLVILIVALLSFFAGFRAPTVGRDTVNYINLFHQTGSNIIANKEIGFTLFNKLVIWLTNSDSVLLLCYAIIIYGLVVYRFWELRSSISFSCAVITFYSINYFESLNIMRQYVAVAIIFFATRYLAKREYGKYTILMIIAVLFHTSALLGAGYLAVELLFWKSLNGKQKLSLISISILGLFLFPYMLDATEKYYQFFRWTTIDIGLRVFALFCILLVSLFYFKKSTDFKDRFYLQTKGYFLHTVQWYYLIGCLLGIIGYFYELMGRISIFYTIYTGVYFGLIFKDKEVKNRKWIRIVLLIMIIFVVGYILYNYLFVLNGSMHHPYKFIWDA